MPALILAGPIIRRTENNRVCVWLATDQKAIIKGFVYADGDVTTGIGIDTAASNGAPSSVQLGDKLYVHLIQLRPSGTDAFPLDTILLYDLHIGGKTLSEHGLIGGVNGINYPGYKLPSFTIPSVLENILYGSCRKPHTVEANKNYGIYDQLATADTVVGDKAAKSNQRPSHLLLTGDQIYADDVGGPLLANLVNAGKTLTGWDEAMPLKNNSNVKVIRPAETPLYGRKVVLKNEDAGISSGHGENHLMTFGEYAAMHIAVWSGNKIDFPSAAAVKDILAIDPYNLGDEEVYDNFGTMYASIYDDELKRLVNFNKTLPKVRRLLANISTLMICDDHEVTDDWNIRKKWEEEINDSPLGRRLLGNALAAYWAFQGWGNDPDSFDSAFITAVSEHLTNKTTSSAKATKYENTLLATHWLYSVPTSPPIICLDVRTQRYTDNKRSPARLIGPQGLKDLQSHFDDVVRPNYDTSANTIPAIIVSPSPVFGFKPVEFAQKKAFGTGLASVESLDYESWIANEKGYNGFISKLNTTLKISWAVFISGDVHYSFVKKYVKGDVAVKGTEKLLFDAYQLTSSPIMNAPSAKYFFRKVIDEKHAEHARRNNYLLPSSSASVKRHVIDESNIGMLTMGNGEPMKAVLYYTNKSSVLKKYTYDLTASV